MPDETIVCVECREEFVFAESERVYYEKNNLHKPKRCKPCRDARKQAKKSQGG